MEEIIPKNKETKVLPLEVCSICNYPMYREYNKIIERYTWRCSNPNCPES